MYWADCSECFATAVSVIPSLIVIGSVYSSHVYPGMGSNVQVVCKSLAGKERCV